MQDEKYTEKYKEIIEEMKKMTEEERDFFVVGYLLTALETSGSGGLKFDTSKGLITVLGDKGSKWFEAVMEAKKKFDEEKGE